MEKKGVHRLFILDCCRVDIRGGNATGGGKGAGMPPTTASKATTYLECQDVSEVPPPAIISSSSPGQMSQELWGSDRHGLFTKALIETLDADDVHGFDDFRKTIGVRMKQLKSRLRRENPEDKFTQVASVEGSIDFDIPFWPPWEGAKPRRRRSDDMGTQESRRGESRRQGQSRRSRVATAAAVASAFEEAEMLSRCFYLKSNFIPADKLANACESMGVRCAPSRVLALYDDTVFGGSREGFVIAPEGIYAKNLWQSPVFFPWGAIDSLGYKSGAIVINGIEVSSADDYLSMEAKDAVRNGIREIEEQISGEKFVNTNDEEAEIEAPAEDEPDEEEAPESAEEDGDESADNGNEDEGECDFRMTIEDTFNIVGRGYVATGKIERGTISVGDRVRIVNGRLEVCESFVEGINIGKMLHQTAVAGSDVGLLFRKPSWNFEAKPVVEVA